jgi:uncharacterized protein (DUF58 family)
MARSILRDLARSNRILPRKLRFTREGKFYILITFGMGFAAINTGNNLLYLLLGMLLSLIVMSGVLSETAIGAVIGRRLSNDEAFAGSPSRAYLEVENGSRRFSGYSLKAREQIEDAGVDQRPAPVFHLGKQERRTVSLDLRFPHRGRYHSYGVRVETGFPFALFEKARFHESPREYLVYPRLLPSLDEDQAARLLIGDLRSSERVGRGLDYYGVRDFRQGDPPNRVHWKLTAKKDRLVTREFEDLRGREARLFLMNAARDHDHGEPAVSLAATLVERLVDLGVVVRLATLDSLAEHPPVLEGRERILGHLALLPMYRPEPAQAARAADFLDARPGRWLVIVSTDQAELTLPGAHVLVAPSPAELAREIAGAPGGRA